MTILYYNYNYIILTLNCQIKNKYIWAYYRGSERECDMFSGTLIKTVHLRLSQDDMRFIFL